MEPRNGNRTSIYRPFGNAEYGYYIFNKVVSKNVIKGKLTPTLLKKALLNLVRENSILRCHIEENNNEKFFIEKTEIDIEPFLSIKIIKPIFARKGNLSIKIDKLYEQELNKDLDTMKGLWRVLLITDCKNEDDLNENSTVVMILTIHHCIADGNSIMTAVGKILSHAQKLYDNPLYEEPINTEKTKSINNILSEYIQGDQKSSSSKGNKEDEIKSLFNHIRFMRKPKSIKVYSDFLSKSEFQRIRELKKEQNCALTFTPIFCAAFFKALLVNNEELDKNELIKINCNLATNVRNFKNQTIKSFVIPEKYQNDIACYIASLRLSQIISETTDVRVLSKDIYIEIEGKKWERLHRLSSSSVKDYTLKNLGYDIIVSNIGIIEKKGIDQNDLKLCVTSFTGAGQFPGLVLSLLSYDNILHWSILYTDSWFSIKYIKQLSLKFKEKIFEYFYSL